MSDGPHKSLPMPPAWKRVAERADNAAFESDEIRKALIQALEHDCRTEMSPALLDDVRSLIEGQDASLFKSDVRPQLEALRTDAGYGIGNRLLNNLIQLSPQGEADFNLLARAMADALEDHAERRSRQVEEHYQRKSTASRAHNTRERMAQSISGSPIEALARQIFKIEAPSKARSTLRQQGLDDGVKL
jgi:K+-sensing histidine kinase KdpD